MTDVYASRRVRADGRIHMVLQCGRRGETAATSVCRVSLARESRYPTLQLHGTRAKNQKRKVFSRSRSFGPVCRPVYVFFTAPWLLTGNFCPSHAQLSRGTPACGVCSFSRGAGGCRCCMRHRPRTTVHGHSPPSSQWSPGDQSPHDQASARVRRPAPFECLAQVGRPLPLFYGLV